MNIQHAKLNKYLAGFTFLSSLILYMITLAPTASFWDPGEFIAVANGLQVTHPPGAPLYLLIGRIFSMFASDSNVAYYVNLVSAVASAFTIMFLYLTIVRLVREFKDHPDTLSAIEKIGLYGGGLIGALAFAVSDTFWFNAVEAEVYAVSMFFTAIVVWLALKWAEHHEDEGNERWLILIAYMFGLALGVHLLNLLALFFVALIVYFKKYEFKWTSFLAMGAISVVSFSLIFPFTVINIPAIAGSIGPATSYLLGPVSFIVLLFAAIAAGLWYTQKNGYRIANIIILAYTMIIIGFSSYSLVMIRSIANPPIDENDPETVEAFVKYIKRDQYGSTPIFKGSTYDNSKGTVDRQDEVFFPRRWSTQPRHVEKYAEYSSDLDYFLNYQVNHMYIRYFNWNFVGRTSDIQDTGWSSGFSESDYEDNPAHNNFFYLPFLLGLFGLIFHYQRDWRRALAVTAIFLVTGLAIIIFLNQYPFQPRERDYAYVGSFFAFSIWLGLGFTGLIETLRSVTKSAVVGGLSFAIVLAGIPGVMLSENFDDHDRSGRYVAPDYAYNLLNSVQENGIIFTNGDNDTFPLWYLQEVEGVRQDVRVVCLSLLNTPWYIKQMKNQWSHTSSPLTFSYTDEEIENIENKFNFDSPDDFYEPEQQEISIDKSVMRQQLYGETPELQAIDLKSEYNPAFDYSVDELDSTISFYYEGNFLGQDRQGNKMYYTRVQDDMVLDIIKNNINDRPIYFAVTVSRDAQLNMQDYFYLEGQAYRVVPKKHNQGSGGAVKASTHQNRIDRFRLRNTDDPDAYFDENIRRMLDNYRELISQGAVAWLDEGQIDSARALLAWGEEKIPFTVVEGNQSSMIRYAIKYMETGANEKALELAEQTQNSIREPLVSLMEEMQQLLDQRQELQRQMQVAQSSGDFKMVQKLQTEAAQSQSQFTNYRREMSFMVSRILLIQNIYFSTDNDEKAVELGNWANEATQNQLGIPTEKDEVIRRSRQLLY
jgi:hypothetical protein